MRRLPSPLPLRFRLLLAAAVSAAATLIALFIATRPEAGRARSVSPDARSWNVVMIVTDDERYDDNRVMHRVQSLLAAHGITFTDFNVTTSECCPSRASILTGQYSHHDHVVGNFGTTGYTRFDESNTLATWLDRAGYSTALVGKYLNDYSIYGHHHVPPGWHRWVAMDSVPEESYYRYTLNVQGHLQHRGRKPSDYSTSVLSHYANGFLEHTREPFFLYYAPIAPHLPAIPAPRDEVSIHSLPPMRSPAFDEANISDKPWHAWHARQLSANGIDYVSDEIRRRRLESLRAVDRSVAQLVRTLRRRHTLDRTVIFFLSDNGFLMGEHRLGGKIWPYAESSHVPFVVRTPWAVHATRDHQPVLNIDLAATVAELAGISPGKPQDGRSLVPLLHGRTVPWRADFLEEYRGDPLLRLGGPPRFKAVRTRRFLYVEYDNGWRELYDHAVDPHELRNVAGKPAYATIRARLARRLETLDAAPPRWLPRQADSS